MGGKMILTAIIGTGAISNSHIEGYIQFPKQCKITALVDISKKKVEEKAAAYGLEKIKIFKDYRELLDKKNIDMVSICLPPALHAEATEAFLSEGIHVLVEKPMAGSLQECDRMLKAADKGKVLLSVVAQNRFKNPLMKLKKVVDSGIVGKILHGQVDSLWWRGSNYHDLWWRGTWKSEGGGPTLNHAVHHIDLLLWMMGMPESVIALMTNAAHTNAEVEDLSIAALLYPDNRLAQITSSLIHHGEQQQLVFQGEHASVSVPWKVSASIPLENGFPQKNREMEEKVDRFYQELEDLPYDGHTAQIKDMLDAIEKDRTPLIDGTAGRQVIELITSIYKAASSKAIVSLPLNHKDPFYTKEGIIKEVPYFYKKSRRVEQFTQNTITLGRDYGKGGT